MSDLSLLSDAELVEQAKQGCNAAWGQLYERYYPRLVRCLHRKGFKDPDSLAQAAFLQAWRKIESYSDQNFIGWLWTIGFNQGRTLYRQEKKRSTSSGLDAIRHTKSDPKGSGPSNSASLSELREALPAALGELPEDQHLAFVLHKHVGMTQHQTAWALTLTLDEVRGRVTKAEKALGIALSEFG